MTVTLICLLASGCDKPDEFAHRRRATSSPEAPASFAPSAPIATPSPSTTPGRDSPDRGLGTFNQVADGGTGIVGAAGSLITYCVRVEDGINSFSPNEFAAVVDAALADSRSWIAARRWRFQRIPTCENARLRVNLATPATVDRNCASAAQTVGQWSCFNNRAVHINLTRWKIGVVHANGDLPAYRVMVVNHEVGHSLGFGHVACPGTGRTAPIMLPQSRGLNGCVFNPYPYPDEINYVT